MWQRSSSSRGNDGAGAGAGSGGVSENAAGGAPPSMEMVSVMHGM